MEIVILPDNQAIGSLGADAIENLLRRKPDAVLGLATGSSPLAIYDELADRCVERPPVLREGARLHPGRVRRTARRPPGELPERHRQGLRLPGRLRPGRRPGTGRPGPGHPGRVCRLRGGDRSGGRGRPADPGHRHRRPHRLQRTRLLAGLADPHQDPDQADPDRQRPILRRRARRGAHALPDPGPGHHHVRPARAPRRDRHRQGRGGPPPGRGRGERDVAGQPSCSTTRTSPSCWTTPRPAGCSWPTTTARPTWPSPPGRASDSTSQRPRVPRRGDRRCEVYRHSAKCDPSVGARPGVAAADHALRGGGVALLAFLEVRRR